MTQKSDLLDWLLGDERQGKGKITTMQAFVQLGVTQLSARVIELERDGWIIPRRTITVKAKNGRECRVTQYLRPVRKDALREQTRLCLEQARGK